MIDAYSRTSETRVTQVLILDDNRDFAENLAEILTQQGADVCLVRTAGEARRILEDYTPDIAFVDLRLPDGSGEELVAHIGQRHPDALSIVLTGNASIQSAIASVNAGAFGYLLKDMPVEAVLSAFRNARERLALEQQKRDLEAQLRHQEQLAIIGQMAATLAHEIKNPLTGIAQALEVILESTGEPPGMVGIKDSILTRFRRLNELVEDLLQFSKPVAIKRARVDIHQIIDGAIDELIRARQMEGVRVIKDVGPGAEIGNVDSNHLHMLLRNLLQNAAIAMAKSPAKELRIRVRRTKDRLLFEVEDTGTGIADEILPQIFKPFFTTRTRGTGLGLALASRIVEEHGGSITARNIPQGGACFSVQVPG